MIQPSKCGCLARVKKQNEIIKALNPLLRIEMREGDKLAVHYSDNNVVLEIPNSTLGYNPSIWEEIVLSVCVDGTPTDKTFLVKI